MKYLITLSLLFVAACDPGYQKPEVHIKTKLVLCLSEKPEVKGPDHEIPDFERAIYNCEVWSKHGFLAYEEGIKGPREKYLND